MTPSIRFRRRPRRGATAIVTVVLLVVGFMLILGMTIGVSRDQDLSARRLETVRAFYAAEAGTQMAVRELMENADEDGDGGIGTISNDGDPGNNPAFGSASVSVIAIPAGQQTTLQSIGVSGDAQRIQEAVLQY